MSVLVVGSIAYDTIETPFEKVEQALGGSATNFSNACGFFSNVNIVAVVGTDFALESLDFLVEKGVDIKGVYQEEGKTFRWSGRYHENFNERDDLETHLNVFENFKPVIPEDYKKSEILFLANIHPKLQLDVLMQMDSPRFVALDTIKFYIDNYPEDLKEVLKRVTIVFLNDYETRELSGEYNLLKAARKVLEMGPEAIVVKKGEHGALLISKDMLFAAPAFPLEVIRDPTGAGDTFAGGFLGYLAKTQDFSENSLKKAVIYGTVLGSFCVEKIGQTRLNEIDLNDIEQRFKEFRDLTYFG